MQFSCLPRRILFVQVALRLPTSVGCSSCHNILHNNKPGNGAGIFLYTNCYCATAEIIYAGCQYRFGAVITSLLSCVSLSIHTPARVVFQPCKMCFVPNPNWIVSVMTSCQVICIQQHLVCVAAWTTLSTNYDILCRSREEGYTAQIPLSVPKA